MALMGINQPARAPQPVQQERKSDFDKLMEALQVANQGFGVAVNYAKLGEIRERREQAAQLQPAQLEKLQAQTGKLKAETADIERRPAAELAELQRKEKEQKITDTRAAQTALSERVAKFQNEPRIRSMMSAVADAELVEKTLRTGSGPGAFIGIVRTIRGVAQDVGPVKDEEIKFIVDQFGIPGTAEKALSRWLQGEVTTLEGREKIIEAVRVAADTTRNQLDDMEALNAKNFFPSVQDFIDEDVVKQRFDTSDFINTRRMKLNKDLQKRNELQPKTATQQGASAAPTVNRMDPRNESSMLDAVIDSMFGG